MLSMTSDKGKIACVLGMKARWVADAHMICPCARGSDMGWLTMTRCPDASISAGRWLTSSLNPAAPNAADPLLRTAMDQ